MNKKLFVISGFSGVGKGTVINRFMQKHKDFVLSVSCTTRKPRPGETDGVNYFFLSNEEFEKNIRENKFLEYAKFAEHYYGTKKKYIEEKLREGFHVILEIDTQGALQVKKKIPEAVLIFIAPPSIEELEHRLRGRHTEDEETIQKRLSQVSIELERAKQYDYTVVNDDVDRAVSEIEEIVKKSE
ncbi:MAG TPA: guanylate kinase [Cyanobacteria bacterium UBA11991]|nr:guanylate kinase [Cyanobacteriota bacterium]MDY6357919.1 guanylate kinase [Cyanobacteriota bacterium]MDY6363869.1 guanylate kinase [Cyanobacteriota bacterium]MDY6383595.1 guanylate kinase [Cyanobacteriota bacterium]HCB11394.1 guanylate kinase [Cyanobacteria bacterium UBA11991]